MNEQRYGTDWYIGMILSEPKIRSLNLRARAPPERLEKEKIEIEQTKEVKTTAARARTP